MRQSERSMQTKARFSAALRKRLQRSDLDDISVADLARDCNLDRKTFYYHFDDVYDLFGWSVHEVIRESGVDDLLRDNPRKAIVVCANVVTSTPDFARALRSAVGCMHVRECIAQDVYAAIEGFVDQHERNAGVVLEDGYRSFLVVLLGDAVGEVFVELASGRLALPPEQFADYLVVTLRAAMERVVSTLGR